MPKRRDQIRMGDDALWNFIGSQKTVQVATLNRDGSSHLMPLWFALDERCIILETFSKSQKIKNLERDPRITLLFEDGEEYTQLRGASLYGRAELVRDVEAVHQFHRMVIRRNSPELADDVIDQVSRGMAPKKTAVLIRPHKVITWDHSKLAGIY
ncbi:MAG: pyridoxamine 5'-phosphate oxidase family protein [Myxococcota bacterium]